MAGSARSSRGNVIKFLLISAAEFVILLGLWMIFVSLPELNEILAGLGAALLGAVGDAVVKAADSSRFRPRLRHVLLILAEPWYIANDTFVVFWELVRRMAGLPSRSQLKVIPFEGGGDDMDANARRALATAYSTIAPNTIVLGIDRERNLLLLHQVAPAETPWLMKQLGVR
jgi:multisubunit Na+/H+ antiporter MnhE subunit